MQIKIRVIRDLRDRLRSLAKLHEREQNEEAARAIEEHLARHDPAKCRRCAEIKERRSE